MVMYRRNRVAGATYFFTLTLNDRRSSLLTDNIDKLRDAFKKTRTKWPFDIDAVVVLPEHCHVLMKLPADDDNYPKRWRSIKSHFSRSLVADGIDLNKNSRGEYNVWQKRYWEHTIRDEEDWRRHVDYIHYNPVKHGLVDRVKTWHYSSFHKFVQNGLLPEDWGGVYREPPGEFGE